MLVHRAFLGKFEGLFTAEITQNNEDNAEKEQLQHLELRSTAAEDGCPHTLKGVNILKRP
jgi:hypothetical protein